MKGQTIIEVLVALTTAVVIVSAITISVITALRNAEYSRTQNNATRYAQEGIEFIRFLRDSNYTQFQQYVNSGNLYCLGKNSTQLAENTDGTFPCTHESVLIDSVFSRSIAFDSQSEYCKPLAPSPLTPTPVNTGTEVTVTVGWTDSKCPSSVRCHTAELISCLSDYALVGTPGVNATNTPSPTPQN